MRTGVAVGGYFAAGIATMALAIWNDRKAGRSLAPSDVPLVALGVIFWPAAWYDEVKGQGGLGLLPQKPSPPRP